MKQQETHGVREPRLQRRNPYQEICDPGEQTRGADAI